MRVGAAFLLCVGLGIAMSSEVVADIPVASPDSASTSEDSTVLIDVLANDTGLTDGGIVVSITSGPSNGSAAVDGTNKVTYTPDPDFSGDDTFVYRVQDADNDWDEANVSVFVSAVNDAPVAQDDLVTTEANEPVVITLLASDPDIDPFAPSSHPLEFSILSGPSHGSLSGDISSVVYDLPNLAFVTLTYTPESGFLGADSISFYVTDIFDSTAIGLVQISVSREQVFGALTGMWDVSITFEAYPFSVSEFASTFSSIYKVGTLDLQADAGFAGGAFSSLQFKANFPVGEDGAVRSTCSFAPSAMSFNYWQTVTTFSFLEMAFTHTLHLPQSPSDMYCKLVARGNVVDLSFIDTVRFGGLCKCFEENVLQLSMPWPDCDLVIDTRLEIDDQGFQEFSFTLQEIPFLSLDVLGFAVSMRLKTAFTPTSKTLTPTLLCKSDWMGCVKFICEVTGSVGLVQSLSVYGLQMQMTFPNGIELHTATSLEEAKNASVTGRSEYFEVWRLRGPVESCCGSAGRWEIDTYFDTSSMQLFDWGMTAFAIDAALTDRVRLVTAFELRSDPPTWEWEFGLKTAW